MCMLMYNQNDIDSSYSDSSFNSFNSNNKRTTRSKFKCPLLESPNLDRERLLKEIVVFIFIFFIKYQ